MRRGSSSSASCSAKSPVSLHREKSDRSESEDDGRISVFSSWADAEWSSKRREEVGGMLRRGIPADGEESEGEIVAEVRGLFCSGPLSALVIRFGGLGFSFTGSCGLAG